MFLFFKVLCYTGVEMNERNTEMDERQAREEIRFIQTMVEKTRQTTAESGALFVFWGVICALALTGSYILGSLKLYRWEWANWVGMTGIGWIVTIVYSIRRGRRESVRTYTQTAARHLYFSCGLGFALVGLIFPAAGVYSNEAITVLISAVSGILFFVLGGIFALPFLKGIGLAWWAGAIGLSFFPIEIRIPVYTGLFTVLFLVPAFVLHLKFRRERMPS
jgi:hypothetical protein